jgi:hypothetical protein
VGLLMQEIWRRLISDPKKEEWIHVMSWSNFIRPIILLTSCGLLSMVEVSPGLFNRFSLLQFSTTIACCDGFR